MSSPIQIKEALSKHPEWKGVESIAKLLVESGFQCCLVGGCVRDFLRGQTPHDLDLVTNAQPDEILRIFPDALEIGKQFGVLRVKHSLLPQGRAIEIATFREEDEYFDGRRPERIIWSDLPKDAKRRDFTINALYLDLQTEQLIDPLGGLSDIKRKILRAIGNPEKRFLEDHLRILRALRFSHHFQFSIESQTDEAIQKHLPLIAKLSSERITEEMKKFFSQQVKEGLDLLNKKNVLKILFPQVNDSWQQILWGKSSAWISFLMLLSQCRLDGLEQGVDPSNFFPFFLLSREEKRTLSAFDSFVQKLTDEKNDHAQLFLDLVKKKFIFDFQVSLCLPGERLRKRAEEFSQFLSEKGWGSRTSPHPLISGQDLKELKIKEQLFQKVLDTVYLEQLRGDLQNYDQAVKRAVSISSSVE